MKMKMHVHGSLQFSIASLMQDLSEEDEDGGNEDDDQEEEDSM